MSSRVRTHQASGYSDSEDLHSSDTDDEAISEDKPIRQKRVVKPMKEKISEEMTNAVDQMKKAMKTYDYASLQESFDKFNKLLEKVAQDVDSVPNICIKALIMLDDFVIQSLASKEVRRKMSSGDAKVLNSMKLKLKKKNKQFEELINKYKENPEVSEEEDWEIVDDCDWFLVGGDCCNCGRGRRTEDEVEVGDDGDEWKNIMSGKAKLVDNPFLESGKLTWDMVTKGFKEIVAEKQEKKGEGRIKLLEQGKKGMGKICVEPSESSTRVHILSRDVNYSYIYYHE